MRSEQRVPGSLPESQAELRRKFLQDVRLVPGGDRVSRCLQCGACTGSCPVSYAMDISPRTVVALFRAGQVEEILRSRSIWICASCYMCTTRCPQDIKITDLFYAMKRTAMDAGLFPDRFPVHLLSKNFVRIVNRYGRNHEGLLMAGYYLGRNPLGLLALLPLGWQMFRRGRVSLFPKKIKGLEAIRAMIQEAETLKMPPGRHPATYEKDAVGYAPTV